MFLNLTALDPISLKLVEELKAAPYVVEEMHSDQLVIYFESEENREKYLQIQTSGWGSPGGRRSSAMG